METESAVKAKAIDFESPIGLNLPVCLEIRLPENVLSLNLEDFIGTDAEHHPIYERAFLATGIPSSEHPAFVDDCTGTPLFSSPPLSSPASDPACSLPS